MAPRKRKAQTKVNEVANEKVMKILECPICMEVPLGRIYICISGHSICAACRPKVAQCGLCRQGFTDTRSLAAEAMIATYTFQCKYKAQGCKTVKAGSEMDMHQQNCDYRPVICNLKKTTPCTNNPVHVAYYIQHLRVDHQYKGTDKDSNSYCMSQTRSLKHDYSRANYMKFDGRYFVIRTKTNLDDHNVYWWISIVGTKEEAAGYYSMITTFAYKASAQANVRKIECTAPVYAIRDEFESVRNNGFPAAIPMASLKHFCMPYDPKAPPENYYWSVQCKLFKGNLDATNPVAG